MYKKKLAMYKPDMADDSILSLELSAAAEAFPMEGLGRLGLHLPMEWIEEALASTEAASIRKRRLPAEQVVWLVIALALFRRTSMSEVLESLELVLPNGDASAVSRSAITQARQRLGADPLGALFERTARAYGNIPGKLKRLRQQLKEALKEERRGRQCPRHVKSRPSKYDVRFVLKNLN